MNIREFLAAHERHAHSRDDLWMQIRQVVLDKADVPDPCIDYVRGKFNESWERVGLMPFTTETIELASTEDRVRLEQMVASLRNTALAWMLEAVAAHVTAWIAEHDE